MPQPPEMTAQEMARRILHDAVGRVLEAWPPAIIDEPDGVHRLRTQVRRLRGALAALRRSTDPAVAARLEVSLRRWGRELGEVRDAEVRAQIAADALRRLDVTDEAVWGRLVEAERVRHDGLHARLVQLSELPRTNELVEDLRRFGADPRVAPMDEDARDFLGDLLGYEVHRVKRAAKRVDGSSAAYHELRKSARRLRYLAGAVDEIAPELFGKGTARLAKAGKRIHDTLGDQRDLLQFGRRVERARVHAQRAGESPEPYDALVPAASRSAAERLAQLDDALSRLRRASKKLR